MYRASDVDINAQFAALEVSIDKTSTDLRPASLWASGDGDPDDDEARGFDAILDNPNFAGGPFSFWNRQGIRLTQPPSGSSAEAAAALLRSSKTEGQANFVNPGAVHVQRRRGRRIDAEAARVSVNVNYLAFPTAPKCSRGCCFSPPWRRPSGSTTTSAPSTGRG